MDNLFDIVKTLCDLGYSVVPSKGKHPLVKWKPYQTRLPTDAEHKSWRYKLKARLYGIVTGALSRIIVVDCDSAAAMLIMDDLRPHVRTPRGGGHYYFAYPGHSVKTVAGLLPKIDIRGDGGFVNAIGATPKGEYHIEIMPTPETIYSWDKMPKEILEKMNSSEPASEPAKEAEPGKPIPEGERNDWLFRRACGYRNKGDNEEVIFKKVKIDYEQRCVHDPPMSDEELKAICHSSSKYEPTLTRQSEPPKIISARSLSEMDFPDLIFALPGMICEGFSEIAGRPKSAKSIWTLEAAYSVALGKNLFDGSPCEKGRALYLGLEDGERRLQYRINKLNASHVRISKSKNGGLHIEGVLHDIPEGLDVTTHWPRIGDGGIEELEKYLDEHPDTRLIVVDITKRMMKKKGKGMAYDEDYESVQPLQELATRRRVAILGVHHTRKALANDPVEMVSGTYGRTGAADSVIVVQRVTKDESRFSFTGRGIKEHEMAMHFDENSLSWTSLGDADLYFISEEREEILGLLLDGDGDMSPSEIAKSLERGASATKTLLSRMLRDGIVTKDSKGRYSARRAK